MFFKKILFIAFIGLGILCQAQEREVEFLLITSSKTPVNEVTPFQLRNLFLGKLEAIANFQVTPLQLKEHRPNSILFHKWLFGKHFDWNGYWINQQIKGGPAKPYSIGSTALMLAFLERNHGFIGYISSDRKSDLKDFRIKTLKIK